MVSDCFRDAPPRQYWFIILSRCRPAIWLMTHEDLKLNLLKGSTSAEMLSRAQLAKLGQGSGCCKVESSDIPMSLFTVKSTVK